MRLVVDGGRSFSALAEKIYSLFLTSSIQSLLKKWVERNHKTSLPTTKAIPTGKAAIDKRYFDPSDD